MIRYCKFYSKLKISARYLLNNCGSVATYLNKVKFGWAGGEFDTNNIKFGKCLVSIAEPSNAVDGSCRWIYCPAKPYPTPSFLENPFGACELGMEMAIVGQFGRTENRSVLLEMGEKIGQVIMFHKAINKIFRMRLSIRTKEFPQTFYFIFLYIGKNGNKFFACFK